MIKNSIKLITVLYVSLKAMKLLSETFSRTKNILRVIRCRRVARLTLYKLFKEIHLCVLILIAAAGYARHTGQTPPAW